MKRNRIIAVHLLNDFSGSPFVLRQSLEALVKKGYVVELLTATPGEAGFLSEIEGVTTSPVFYKWSPNKWMTLLLFLYSQLYLFCKVLFKARRSDIVYVNSLLPFGAALGAWIKGAKVLYHIHEVSIKPALLKKFLFKTPVPGFTSIIVSVLFSTGLIVLSIGIVAQYISKILKDVNNKPSYYISEKFADD